MAVTRGHGNPDWGRDEVILALELYFDLNRRMPSNADPRVVALSRELRALPYHLGQARNERFRNPDGVVFKIGNLRALDTGKGLGNTSAMDRAVWAEFGDDPDKVRRLAAAIRGAATAPIHEDEDSETEEFREGRLLTQAHKRRERNRKVRRALIAQRRSVGPLTCDICHRSSPTQAKDLEDAFFEAHHLISLSAATEQTKTRLNDLALLCACCHRLIHRAIFTTKRWLSVHEAQTVLGLPANR